MVCFETNLFKMAESEGFLQGSLLKLNRVSSDYWGPGLYLNETKSVVIAISSEITYQIQPLVVFWVVVSHFFIFIPIWEKIPILTNIFQMG